MKKVRIKKTIIVFAVAVILLAAYLFYSRPMILSLLYLFPRGTRIHRAEPNDFQWEVCFHLKDIEEAWAKEVLEIIQ